MPEDKINSSTSFQITPWEQVDISNHYMFRLVMENPELCKIALERILDIKITKLEVLIAEKSVEYKYASRGIRLDIYAEDDKGVAYDLEMQALDAQKNALGKRTRYYQSLLDGDALKKNTYYSELRKSYVIFICKFDPFNNNFGRYTFNSWCDEDKALNLNDQVTKILLNTKGDKTGMKKELKDFLDYIENNSPNDDYTVSLDNAVKTIKKNEGARDLYMTYEQQLMDERAKERALVCEEMQQYVTAANKRADKAEREASAAKQEASVAKQEASVANQRADKAKQEASVAKQKASAANLKNISNIISICRSANFSDDQIIQQLVEKADMTQSDATKILAEFKL